MSAKHLVVFITTSGNEEARKISREIVNNKLAACVNIVSNIHSVYLWKGGVEESSECLLIAKTLEEKFEKLINKVKEIHSYDVPEVIALPIVKGYEKYLRWIYDSLK